jgi:photosystem II stability/assembly factor-like uncharacterized protein
MSCLRRSHAKQAVLLVAAAFVVLAALSFAQAKAAKPKILQSTSPELRFKGFEEYKVMRDASKFKDLKWQFLGPTNVSGRVTDVAVVTPKGRNYTVYAASASGGVWKTDNEGVSWTPIFENMVTAAIGDIALAPSDQNIVWVGTGEHNIFRSSQAGIGVFKSTDGGKTWASMGLADTNTIARIVVHPTDPDVVYVAAGGHEWTKNAERGVFKTINGGKTWDRVLFINDETGAYDLVMDPRSADTLYAALWQRTRKKWNDPRNDASSVGSGIFKTTDGGKTWSPVDKGLPEARWRGRIGIDLCLSKPDTLYALVDNYEVSREPTPQEITDSYGIPSSGFIKGATVYRSDDAGTTWMQTSGLTPQQKAFMERHSGTYGWVFGQIRVDPNDADTSYIMGVPFSASTDGGKTYTTVRSPGGDNHALWIDPANSNYMVKGFDQGIAVTYDKGKTWRYFRSELNVCQFFDVNYDMATPFKVYGSMQDHGSFRGSVDLSRGRDRIPAQEFESAPGGEGSNHAIDPDDPNVVYSAGFYGTISRSEYGKPGPYPGYPFTKDLLPVPYENEPPLRGQWLAPFILSPHNPHILYHGMQYVFRSLDRGDTWERISRDLTTNDPATRGDIRYQTVFSISESPLRYGLVYAGTDDGRLWVTKDGGDSGWTEITAGLAPGKWMSQVVASAYELGTVYLTQNGKRDDDFTPYVWKSTDYGRTWTSIAKGIPVGPVNVIREDPVNAKILYVGTDMGAYVTADGGQTWAVLGGNLPTCYVHDLIIHPRDNIIVIATHGRGMWALDADKVNNKSARRRFYSQD